MTGLKSGLTLMVLACCLGATAQASSGSAPDDPVPPTRIPADRQASVDQAVAARKEGCRLHPGTCKRGQKAPPQSNPPPKAP